MHTKFIWLGAGLAIGYLFAVKLAAYPGFQQAYTTGAGLGAK
jgi:hypothetical protein